MHQNIQNELTAVLASIHDDATASGICLRIPLPWRYPHLAGLGALVQGAKYSLSVADAKQRHFSWDCAKLADRSATP